MRANWKAGGGLTPWALITGYGSDDSDGGNARATQLSYADVFLAYFPGKNISVTAAYARPGDITIFNPATQRGW